MIRLFLLICWLLPPSLIQVVHGEVIVLRDGLPELNGSILSGGKGGLLFKEEHQKTKTIRVPWSSILRIETAKLMPQLQAFLDDGDQLWRAKVRLLRGDIELSEPIFASMFNKLLGENGEDARLASEGLLRVLISRGALKQALIPWLETVRHQELGVASPFMTLQPILDPATMACPHLPVGALSPADLNTLETYTFTNDTIAAALAELLQRRFLQPSSGVLLHVEDPQFMAQILQASDGSQEAIQILQSRLKKLLPWQQVWAHYSIGVGLLLEKDLTSRDRGMLHLAMASSVDPTLQPWLTGASMVLLSEELAKDGDVIQAKRILHEAKRVFPSHPMIIENKNIYRDTIP
jgi:hypothetical protein